MMKPQVCKGLGNTRSGGEEIGTALGTMQCIGITAAIENVETCDSMLTNKLI